MQDLIDFGFSENIVKAVDAMTRRKEDSYKGYHEKLKKNKIAVAVKITDLTYNSDITRIPNPTEKDFQDWNVIKDILNIRKIIIIKYS